MDPTRIKGIPCFALFTCTAQLLRPHFLFNPGSAPANRIWKVPKFIQRTINVMKVVWSGRMEEGGARRGHSDFFFETSLCRRQRQYGRLWKGTKDKNQGLENWRKGQHCGSTEWLETARSRLTNWAIWVSWERKSAATGRGIGGRNWMPPPPPVWDLTDLRGFPGWSS